MTIVSQIASGTNMTGHVVTAATLGDGLSSFAVWILQLFHLDPPAAVAQGITAVSIFVASYLLQKLTPSA